MKNMRIIVIAFCSISISIGCGFGLSVDPRTREAANVRTFFEAMAAGNDQLAETHLSQSAIDAVKEHCPNASVALCFDKHGRQYWGNLKDVIWDLGEGKSNDGSGSAYTLYWDNTAILIVVVSTEHNGLWEIDGWRGVVSAEGGWPDGLLDGSNPINQFPPSE